MLAPPVRLLPIRVPVGLRLVVKTPGEAGVVPPVVVVFLRPGEAAGQRPGSGRGPPGPRLTCHTAVSPSRSPPPRVLTLRTALVRAHPRVESLHPQAKFRPRLRLERQAGGPSEVVTPRPDPRRMN